MNKAFLVSLVVFFATNIHSFSQESENIADKTLVVWLSLDNLSQKGGSAITIDDRQGKFDGIVFGEIEDARWMAGSNGFQRTQKEQNSLSVETATATEYLQLAIVYRGNNISIYRKGYLYATYKVEAQQVFDPLGSVVMFGRRHLEAADQKNSFTGKIKDARIYNVALSSDAINQLRPGSIESGQQPWAWWDFSNNGLQDVTRKFDNLKLIGEAFLSEGNLVLKGNGASLIASREVADKEWDQSAPVSSTIIQNTRSFREKLLSDPYRPAYHFCVPEDRGSPGDPNGAFYHNGRYHLMYLYNREGSGFSWGHVSSTDLLHWRHHPDGIGPGDGDEGCFSGGGFVDDDGSAILSYWMLWGDKGIGLAKSSDANFEHWQKFENNPVIKSTEWGVTQMKDRSGKDIFVGSADPSNIWKKDGKYYMLTGNLLVLNKVGREPDSPESEKGDRLYLFSSDNLVDWEYVHRFYESDRKWTEASEDNMCPSFLPLPSSPDGGPASDKHLLLFISHNLGCQYYIGNYNDDKFIPENHGRMTWVDNAYFAPEALVDGKGRQVMWSWIFDDRPDEVKAAYGWTGTYGLPRSLWLGEDGTLRMRPVKELQNLRLNEKMIVNFEVPPGNDVVLDSLGEALMELEVTVLLNTAQEFDMQVCASDGGEEHTSIVFNVLDKKLKIDTNYSGLDFGRKKTESAPFQLRKGEPLVLRIFIDKSIVEVFANDRQAIGRRIYPTLGGKGIRLSVKGGAAKVLSLKRWELAPSNPY